MELRYIAWAFYDDSLEQVNHWLVEELAERNPEVIYFYEGAELVTE